MADQDSRPDLRLGQAVRAVEDLPGVPAGTLGTVVMVTGLSWIRYRVEFENGAELNLVDRRYLEPVGRSRSRR